MKFSIFTTGILSLFIMLSVQISHAIVVKKELPSTGLSVAASKIATKSSLIEKAIQQQKNEKKLQSNDSLIVVTAIKARPTQNFFAAQNQSFSRFVQSIFSTSNS